MGCLLSAGTYLLGFYYYCLLWTDVGNTRMLPEMVNLGHTSCGNGEQGAHCVNLIWQTRLVVKILANVCACVAFI